ncbi:ROK family transcriptional regulator [Mesorhizobium sp. ES1-1]|uniref:ROK family transcriptional regulator n=1 Tax=Mesorhizobium sp. ES1-1 TaxID=2876629 RepID=UPI001CCA8E1C|nr:ROK family transcriptional regulator [Mesorhizobium sp. ES1-1]MBZ9676146.1 ROK family transcriptional regulator [Mesorhizobium sp. ES1-1]
MAAADIPNLTDSARAVLRVLAAHGPMTRPKLGAMLDLSKPTMSAAVSELSALGLVASRGRERGAIGRTATIYGIGPGAGYAIGIDVGAAQVRAVAYSIDAQPLAAAEEPIPEDGASDPDEVGAIVLSVAQATMAAMGKGPNPLRAIAVAVPRIVSNDRFDRPGGPSAVLGHLRRHVDVPIILENNVNCAAIGEMHFGAAQGHQTFAFLQVGVRVGLGFITEGRLFRGARGAAGEIGRMPFPWSASETPYREGLEHYLGSRSLVERCRADWPDGEGAPPDSAKDLFARALEGSAPAAAAVARHAADIGRLAAGCIGMLDPGLIVLGGGVGRNPLMTQTVEQVAAELAWPTRIAVSSLGDAGTALGAMKLAVDYSLGLMLREGRHPAVVLPPLSDVRQDEAKEA